ncbi:MAG TPA: DEAD/DEAH box helicase [Myxococcales bacterium]|nr:DEAD/DEAH box helicase [Myxococcales bacterium]
MRRWFEATFAAPTRAQALGWPPILAGKSTLLLAPTGSGKTLAAFLTSLDRLMFNPAPEKRSRCRVLYVSPMKALAVDVERNLRAPIAGIAAQAEREGVPIHLPTVGIRTGDTPAKERAQMLRAPPDVLITTPESLYLLLTSQAREILRSVETAIVDEIHALVSGKRGAHLFISLERVEALRTGTQPLQRIGLSATQRPLDEVARLLGGGEVSASGRKWRARPVEIVDGGSKKQFDLRVEVPVEDLGRIGKVEANVKEPGESRRSSIWPSIHPRLVELIRANRSTMIFVNSRRLSERLAAAINEVAGEEIALAHHGSLAKEKRQQIEDRLKQGELPAIVATSSLELGIDMGAVDLVIQIEAPPSIASGLQRIGRAGHHVGGIPRGVIFPKHRGDLLGSAAAAVGMAAGQVEETFYPRNPLDVLAQQLVAMSAERAWKVDDLYALVRRAAPFAELPRQGFEGVLDMLSGRYPSDEFAELRPRLTWDRVAGEVRAREGAARVAVVNAGTIPDRGLYGVFLASGDEKVSRRVGELDEEMVFESRVGEVFVLGASSWRIEEITQDRVLVSPAPGEPGKMPFWHGDRPGRPLEFGEAVGKLARDLSRLPPDRATDRLRNEHGLDARAADNLVRYLRDQVGATGEVPSDRTIVVERYVDEMGDFRVCVLTPFGARVHAPWATAVVARLSEARNSDIEMMYSDDGMVFRLPESEEPPAPELFFPSPDEIEDLVSRSLGTTSLFAARFRENAARALLLPRRHPGRRSPLWAQRKRAADLLNVARRYGSFPVLLETYRECLRDVFDLPGLTELLRRVKDRRVRVVTADTRTPSPFASSLLFAYVANFIYDEDAPAAERRAQALSVDPAQLRELLGESELRELLDAEAIEDLERTLQRLASRHPVRHADGAHDLLLQLGDLTATELAARSEPGAPAGEWLVQLSREHRAFAVPIAGDERWIAAEDVARFRDALGIAPPASVPRGLLDPAPGAAVDLVSRYARTHGPFRAGDVSRRLGMEPGLVQSALDTLLDAERLVEGKFLPADLVEARYPAGGRGREFCDSEVLRGLKRRSLAKLRKQVEPVEQPALARLQIAWHGLDRKRSGLDALLSVVEQLQGAPIPASALAYDVLPARIQPFRPSDLDLLTAAGEIVWRGIEPIGPRDGRIALYLSGHHPLLAPAPVKVEGELPRKIREFLGRKGASFFSDLQAATSAFPADLVAALWSMVWAGEITNDTLAPLRSHLAGEPQQSRRERIAPSFRSRRTGPAGSEGRWSLLPSPSGSGTERSAALAQVLLARHGVLTREAVHAEAVPGGFASVYEVLKRMEETGRARRGYFVAGLGATQFALPGAEERLRSLREPEDEPQTILIASTDPANPYGAALPWPARGDAAPDSRPQRSAGSHVILDRGELCGYLARGDRTLLAFLPAEEPARSRRGRALATALAGLVESGRRRALLLERVDGAPPESSPLAPFLAAAGFSPGQQGFLKRAPLDVQGLRLRTPVGTLRGPLGPDIEGDDDPGDEDASDA